MIECRGRNKWFNLHRATAWVTGQRAAVSLESKRQYGDMPPIYFAGPINEVLDVLDQLRNQILAGWTAETSRVMATTRITTGGQ